MEEEEDNLEKYRGENVEFELQTNLKFLFQTPIIEARQIEKAV